MQICHMQTFDLIAFVIITGEAAVSFTAVISIPARH